MPVRIFNSTGPRKVGEALSDFVERFVCEGRRSSPGPISGTSEKAARMLSDDGRTDDLLEAIAAHAGRGSEANVVISNFNALLTSSQQDILNFLRSL